MISREKAINNAMTMASHLANGPRSMMSRLHCGLSFDSEFADDEMPMFPWPTICFKYSITISNLNAHYLNLYISLK